MVKIHKCDTIYCHNQGTNHLINPNDIWLCDKCFEEYIKDPNNNDIKRITKEELKEFHKFCNKYFDYKGTYFDKFGIRHIKMEFKEELLENEKK